MTAYSTRVSTVVHLNVISYGYFSQQHLWFGFQSLISMQNLQVCGQNAKIGNEPEMDRK